MSRRLQYEQSYSTRTANCALWDIDPNTGKLTPRFVRYTVTDAIAKYPEWGLDADDAPERAATQCAIDEERWYVFTAMSSDSKGYASGEEYDDNPDFAMVCAYSRETGELLWARRSSEIATSQFFELHPLRESIGMAAYDGKLFIVSADQLVLVSTHGFKIVVLDAATGEKLEEYNWIPLVAGTLPNPSSDQFYEDRAVQHGARLTITSYRRDPDPVVGLSGNLGLWRNRFIDLSTGEALVPSTGNTITTMQELYDYRSGQRLQYRRSRYVIGEPDFQVDVPVFACVEYLHNPLSSTNTNLAFRSRQLRISPTTGLWSEIEFQTSDGWIYDSDFDNRFVDAWLLDINPSDSNSAEARTIGRLYLTVEHRSSSTSIRLVMIDGRRPGASYSGLPISDYSTFITLPFHRVRWMKKDSQGRIWIGGDGDVTNIICVDADTLATQYAVATGPRSYPFWYQKSRSGVIHGDQLATACSATRVTGPLQHIHVV